MLGLFTLLALGLFAAIVTLTAYTAWTLTHPPRRTYASALARGRPGDPGEMPPGPSGPRPWTSWTLRWRDRDLPVWDITGDDASGPTLILSHGWGDSRIGALTRAERLLPMASRVVAWDMPGHGDAPGTCSLGVHEPDALRELVERVGRDRPVVLVGWSLGAGVSIAAATKLPQVGGVIAEAPYVRAATPARNVLIRWALPWRVNLPPALAFLGVYLGVGTAWAGFDRTALARRVEAPLLVLHGIDDDISPIDDGRTIASAAPRGSIVEVPAGHHALWTDEKALGVVLPAVRAWLATIHHARESDG